MGETRSTKYKVSSDYNYFTLKFDEIFFDYNLWNEERFNIKEKCEVGQRW